MKHFKLDSLFFIAFFIIQISFGQDFIDDLYQSNNNYDYYSNHDNTNSIINDSLDYDNDDLDYENRIQKFHNPNYQMSYYWDYGWNNPYWGYNWYTPSWCLSYHNYGWGVGF